MFSLFYLSYAFRFCFWMPVSMRLLWSDHFFSTWNDVLSVRPTPFTISVIVAHAVDRAEAVTNGQTFF